MSYQNIGENSEITHSNSSQPEPKRSHNWFMDGNEAELFPNKKQAVEEINVLNPNSYTALLNSNVYCENQNPSNFPSLTNSFEIDSTIGGFSYGGIRKVKVSQVKDSDEFLSMDAFNEQNNSLSMDLLSMRHPFGEDNIISFGGLNNDVDNISSSGRLVCNYDFLMGQSSGQGSIEEKGLSESKSDAIISSGHVISRQDSVLKKNDQKVNKKIPSNNFPSNVRSLLSTGMLDGVPVKYVAWSREKELHGVIKGATYLCGCKSCTFSKAINAYEFERHAGCKTKHPNNHIYFENGKTVYGVVQELRNTPQNTLFEAIQTITGSQINQKSFRIWKESFLAATRELQRIYGKEEGIVS